jgi:hypothetical protein
METRLVGHRDESFPAVRARCQTAGMDDTNRTSDDVPRSGPAIGRRAFLSRALMATGATAGLLALTGCPGGSQDDDDDDDDGGDDD